MKAWMKLGLKHSWWVLTWLATVNVAIVQVGAILTVHWINGWWYYQSGVEYNCVLLALCASVAASAWGQYHRHRRAANLAAVMERHR